MLKEALDIVQKRQFNKTLKTAFDETQDKKVWVWYRKNKELRSKSSNFLKPPTVATLRKWYSFWKDKIEFTDLDIEYIEFVLSKSGK